MCIAVWLALSIFLVLILSLIYLNSTDVYLSFFYDEEPVSTLEPIIFKGKKNNKAVLCIHELSGTPKSMVYIAEKLYELNKEKIDIFIPAMPLATDNESAYIKKKDSINYKLWLYFIINYYDMLFESGYKSISVIGASIGGSLGLELSLVRNLECLVTISSPITLHGNHFRKKYLRNFMLHFSGLLSLFVKKVKTGKNDKQGNELEKYEGIDGITDVKTTHSFKVGLKSLSKKLYKVTTPILAFHAKQDKVIDYHNLYYITNKVSSSYGIRYLFNINNDNISRCHRLSNHLYTRDVIVTHINNFFNMVGFL